MKLRIRKLFEILFNRPRIEFVRTSEHAILPTKAHNTDTGWDVYATEDVKIYSKVANSFIVDTGLKVGYITPGYWIAVEGRSGLGFKHQIVPFHGIIDNPYRGSVKVLLMNLGENTFDIKQGDRICQLVLYKNYKSSVGWTDTVNETERGAKGFGASGK